ncbi:MAG: hypothetical protein EOS11_10305 [Mesorhizobium sp.]|nr:MAG: hypothetical protein EOS11_10305 [Mesorhizobium sp.]
MVSTGMSKPVTYAEACLAPELFGPWFDGDSWANWRVLDKAIFGEPLDAAELAVFRELTGRDEAPTGPAAESWFIFGRRSGKDVKAASLVSYLATIGVEAFGWGKRLTRGEKGVVQLLAVDRAQAGVCMGYVREMFRQPMLAKLVKRAGPDTIELSNKCSIEITTADQRRTRGRTVIAVVMDEIAHWRAEDSTNPDEAIYQSVTPAMITMQPGALLVGISSPHMRRGLLFRKYRDNWGKDGNILVAKAPTWKMNLTLSEHHEVIREAYDADPLWAGAEYGAEFRNDLEPFLSLEAVEGCIDEGVLERPPDRQHGYVAFIDPSGGSNDAMVLAVAHVESSTVVVDCIRERVPPFSPESVVLEFAETLKQYRCPQAYGDAYGAAWVSDSFGRAGVAYKSPGKNKSELYLNFLPTVNSGGVALLDHAKLKKELVALERRTTRGGRDTVDHPKGANCHDDVANAVAGVVAIAAQRTAGFMPATFYGPRPQPKFSDPLAMFR